MSDSQSINQISIGVHNLSHLVTELVKDPFGASSGASSKVREREPAESSDTSSLSSDVPTVEIYHKMQEKGKEVQKRITQEPVQTQPPASRMYWSKQKLSLNTLGENVKLAGDAGLEVINQFLNGVNDVTLVEMLRDLNQLIVNDEIPHKKAIALLRTPTDPQQNDYRRVCALSTLELRQLVSTNSYEIGEMLARIATLENLNAVANFSLMRNTTLMTEFKQIKTVFMQQQGIRLTASIRLLNSSI